MAFYLEQIFLPGLDIALTVVDTPNAKNYIQIRTQTK